jgi:hypothetical protein
MSFDKYDLVGLWFQIYRLVYDMNEGLGESGLDKSQLREVTTLVFIGYTQRGIVRPVQMDRFLQSVMRLVEGVKDRSLQESIYQVLSEHVKKGVGTNGNVLSMSVRSAGSGLRSW